MSGQSEDALPQGEFARVQAIALLSGGMPLTLSGRGAQAFIEQSKEALRELGDTDPLLSLKLLVAQTIASAHFDIPSAAAPAQLAQVYGPQIGGELAEAYAQLAWGFAHPAPDHAAERERIARRVLSIAASRGKHSEGGKHCEPGKHSECGEMSYAADESDLLVAAAHTLLFTALLEQGKIRELDAELVDVELVGSALTGWASLGSASSGSTSPGSTSLGPAEWFRVLRLMLDGESVAAAMRVAELYARTGAHDPGALALYTAQSILIHWIQGSSNEAEGLLLAARRENPEQLFWATSLARLWMQQGRTSSADLLLETLPEVSELPRDKYWMASVAALGEIALISGSRKLAEDVRDLLQPYSDHLISVGVGIAFAGTVAGLLGGLEHRLGNLAEARKYLEQAVVITGKIGALAWHAEAQIVLAEFAIHHEILEIPSYPLLTEARATSEARGFSALALRAMHRPQVRVLGTFEVVSFCGTRAEWSSRKARELLKMLIAARGNSRSREVYMEILWPGELPSTLGNRFSVAVNVVRRALDPQRLLPTQHHVITEGDSIRLDLTHLDVDLERFLMLAKRQDAESRDAAAKLYRGEAFSDEVYADWAMQIRDHAKYWHGQLDLHVDRALLTTD